MVSRRSFGPVLGFERARTSTPGGDVADGATTHLVKFHLTRPGFGPWLLRNWNSGCACFPLTLTLAKIGNCRPGKRESTFCMISGRSPGSCPKNWLQGNASTSKP
eukprot:Amastigsp_a339217_1581.p3 type:complete len:105 gc:universal Amastigsp_a339217_1581:540-226(-)